MKYSPLHAKNIHEFLGLGLDAKLIADKHFPHDCPERFKLLDILNGFAILWNLHYSLERTRDKMEQIRAITLPKDREVIELALYLEDIAATLKDAEAEKVVKRASEVLHIWYRLYLNLEQLMEVSAALRLGMESPESES
ncbi:hypothetical protein [Acidicapsa acidisoli]|uniref:hypothetical protein n=1 Tax=Acidicapsa acidisoli TaxID=1615681 RepID=UPI0021DFD33C|nr:hypothetical protein [Acidicapsa acidisoli]